MWAAVVAATAVVVGVTVGWFTSVPNETADTMELVSSSWSDGGGPVLTVVTRLRRSDGRRANLRGNVWTKRPPYRMKENLRPDLANRALLITAEIGFVRPPRQPVVLECYAVRTRACRGLQLLASWERKLLHRPSRWLASPALVRLPDITVPGPSVASTSK